MSDNAYAVIGANWGDEGKGMAVDAISHRLTRPSRAVTVVRSNGGAQAGHGVERPEGGRHVFHQVGSGAFAGARTHLSQFFVAHPMVLQHELRSLEKLGVAHPMISIDPRALVTTPWDMAINQAIEMQRDKGRHGSCGLGFGETIERCGRGFALFAADIWADDLSARLAAISQEWVPQRLAELGIDILSSPLKPVLTGAVDLLSSFLKDCRDFAKAVSLVPDVDLRKADAVVIEGAQGLQLDMDWGAFPHVTRSNTGIRNMLAIAREAGIAVLDVTYMTRAYATRHGAGPLPHEDSSGASLGWVDIFDLTNQSNEWQGAIREAPLDIDLLHKTVGKDLTLADGSEVEVRAGIGVTCLDQVRDRAEFYQDGKMQSVSAREIAERLSEGAGLPLNLASYGPTRTTAQVLGLDICAD